MNEWMNRATNRQKKTENRWTDEKSTDDGRKKCPKTTKKVEKQNKHTSIQEEREMQAFIWIKKDSYVEMEWCRIWMWCYCVSSVTPEAGLIYKSHSESQQPDGQNKQPLTGFSPASLLPGQTKRFWLSVWNFGWLYLKHEIWLVVSTLWLYCTFSLFGSLDLFL